MVPIHHAVKVVVRIILESIVVRNGDSIMEVAKYERVLCLVWCQKTGRLWQSTCVAGTLFAVVGSVFICQAMIHL